MIRISTIRIVEYVVIGISGLCFLLCLGCALYAVPWNRTRRKQVVTKDFNVFWKTRLVLQIASALWLLVQWLRLEALWQPGSQVFPSQVTGWTGNGTLCRLYLCISLGLLEPFCLFTAVLLCRSVLSKRQPKQLGWPNAWVLGVALLLTVPFVAAQTVAAWMSVLVRGRDWERRLDAGRFMLASFVVGSPELCDNSDGRTCLMCFFPAAVCIIACLSSALAALLLWRCTQRMIKTVINRRLRCRLRAFQLLMIAGMVAMCATRSAALVRGTPFSWAFQMIWLAHFLTLPLVVTVYTMFLVVIPVWDTDRAAKGVQRSEKEAARLRQAPLSSTLGSGQQMPARTPSSLVPGASNAAHKQGDTLLTMEHEKSEVDTG